MSCEVPPHGYARRLGRPPFSRWYRCQERQLTTLGRRSKCPLPAPCGSDVSAGRQSAPQGRLRRRLWRCAPRTLDRQLAARPGLGKRFKPKQALRAYGLTAIKLQADARASAPRFIRVQKDDASIFQRATYGLHVIDGTATGADRAFHAPDRLQREARRVCKLCPRPIDERASSSDLCGGDHLNVLFAHHITLFV